MKYLFALISVLLLLLVAYFFFKRIESSPQQPVTDILLKESNNHDNDMAMNKNEIKVSNSEIASPSLEENDSNIHKHPTVHPENMSAIDRKEKYENRRQLLYEMANDSSVEIKEKIIKNSDEEDQDIIYVNDIEMRRESWEAIESYFSLHKELKDSIYLYKNGEITTTKEEGDLNATEKESLDLIEDIFYQIKDRISIQEGTKVVIHEEKNTIVIIFGNILPPGTRGGDYSAKITIDSKTGEIIQLL